MRLDLKSQQDMHRKHTCESNYKSSRKIFPIEFWAIMLTAK